MLLISESRLYLPGVWLFHMRECTGLVSLGAEALYPSQLRIPPGLVVLG
jgi:hypothetical protein